ncbi:MAG TPA: alpha/beta fold hydrolase [Caulobacter sp.]|nr:alpha/beta fold hydrolase [Caulobacter sp.]
MTVTRRRLLAAGLAAPIVLSAARASAQGAGPPSLYEILKEPEILDAALSPSGGDIAVLGERIGENDARTTYLSLLKGDDPAGTQRRLDLGDVDIEAIAFAKDDRLLVWVKKEVRIMVSGPAGRGDGSMIARRVVSMALDGSSAVPLLSDDKRAFKGNPYLGSVVDFMPADPRRVLMQVPDFSRGVWALYRVDVYSGASERIELGGDHTEGWFSQDGVPVLRYDSNARGTVTSIFSRAPGEADWSLLRRVRRDERGRLRDFAPVAVGSAPGVILVAARLEGDATVTVRPFDLKTRQFGAEAVRRPSHDVETVVTDASGRMVAAAYIDDRLGYDFAEAGLKPHHRAVEGFLEKECNVALHDLDKVRNRMIFRADGPREPGAFFFYDKSAQKLEPLGATRPWLTAERLAKVEPLKLKARDGQALTAYLTVPLATGPRPLVVMPHGGPEVRDHYAWNDWAQALAARGWMVLQPNFRGSDGYGEAFRQAGRKRWGDLMQQDVEDCVAHVLATGRADPKRAAILGASYGGYAALMGAVLRPDLYRGAVSINGDTDLVASLAFEREREGEGSPSYEYWKLLMGDPATDGAKLVAASPARRAAEIACPVLLICGDKDQVVDPRQSKIMRDALRGAKKSVDYLEVKDMAHGGWTPQQSMTVLSKAIGFLEGALK